MEQRFYKVRLSNGRVIGPIDLDRLKLFILKDQITGLEVARLYPTGDWKDINTYPEIAELLMQKLEGKLTADAPVPAQDSQEAEQAEAPVIDRPVEQSTDEHQQAQSGITLEQVPPVPLHTQTGTPSIEAPPPDPATRIMTQTVQEGEATVVVTPDDEHTMMYSPEDEKNASSLQMEDPSAGGLPVARDEQMGVQLESGFESEVPTADPQIAQEKTAMLTLGRPPGKDGEPAASEAKSASSKKKKKLFTVAVAAALGILVLFGSEEGTKQPENIGPFRVELPVARKSDPQKSEKLYLSALPIYAQDTVDGYRRAAKIFRDAVSYDQNNARALCFLASSYMNLIDVVNRDEAYFNVITRIIEVARATGLDLAETVIADVELYHILGNPDAAITRIVEFTKTHQWGVEMLYYLALSFYLKGKHPDALAQLNKIDPKDYYSPKILYLYGLIYEKNDQLDEALKAYTEVVRRSPKHIKARTKVAVLYFRKDNLPEAGKHAEYVIQHKYWASNSEVATAHYIRARMHQVAARDTEALSDLEVALKNDPDNQDILLDYYTVKAKLGAKIKDAPGKAKMFHYLALGERASKQGNLDEALSHFFTARDAQYNDAAPLVKVAEIFQKKGDLQAAKTNLEKAIVLEKKRIDLYPKYINVLIEAYEFEDAARALASYKELHPPIAIVDKLQGDYYFKQQKLQEAHAYYKRALSSSNVDSRVYVSYANLMFAGGDFRNAAFYYGLAQRFDPFNVDATVGIGKSLAEIEGVESGVTYVQEALNLSPHKAALLNGIAEVYLRKGDYGSALKFAENALTTDAAFALPHKTRGAAYAGQNKMDEALDAYLTYTNLAPLDPSGHIERYKLYIKKKDLVRARESIEKVISNYPKYPGAHYLLGELYREGVNYKAALEAANIEIKNNPGHIDAYVLAGTAYNLLGDHANALAVLSKALALQPQHVPTLVQAGFANQKLNTYAAAQSMFERAQQQDSGNPEIHKRLGSLFHDMGNYDRARQHFRAYLDLYPNAPDRAEMEKYIKH